jgi:hypothetical protein
MIAAPGDSIFNGDDAETRPEARASIIINIKTLIYRLLRPKES